MNDKTENDYAQKFISEAMPQSNVISRLQARTSSSNADTFSFILSGSRMSKKDDLNMWRLYGDDSKGVCLWYKVDDELPDHFFLAKVSYAKNGTHAELSYLSSKMGKGVVVPANYNCPGQLVISGNVDAVNAACEKLKAAGAKRALVLPVGGAFHSPLMQPAAEELQKAIEEVDFLTPRCPIYQNVDAQAHTDAAEIKKNLMAQLTASVKWTQEVNNMIEAGATEFTECGPGKALQGMIAKIAKGNDAVTVKGIGA